MVLKRDWLGILACLLASSVIGCATLRAESDFDSKANFVAYQTFAILDPLPTEAGEPTLDIVRSPLIEARIADALRQGLVEKGLVEAAWDAADLQVAFSVGSRRAAQVTSYPSGPWPGPWRYDHWERVTARIYTQGVLVVDIVDSASRKLVWRGWVTDAVSSRTDIDAEVRRAVGAILAEYPPAPVPASQVPRDR